VKDLERELARKDRALAETAALLVLRKKASAIWGDGRTHDQRPVDTHVKLQVRANTTKTKTARLWSYVRDERLWCGAASPCAWSQFSVGKIQKN